MKYIHFFIILAATVANLLSAPFALANSCATNLECPSGYYCQKAPGDCSGSGICSPKPSACIALWDPVCGCDGQTYSNSCYAAAAGVNVAYSGVCMPGTCSSNNDCSASHYCAKSIGDCDGLGTCTERPTICPDVWDPVCGCDGQTYGNSCEAAMVGINVDYEGECISSSCAANGDCSPTEYCAKSIGDCDGSGTCTERPTMCPDLWDPVCGCDGQTYGNSCEAAAAGVNIKYKGSCSTCVNPPIADINGDCWVDLADMAIFASEWMLCGLDNSAGCFLP